MLHSSSLRLPSWGDWSLQIYYVAIAIYLIVKCVCYQQDYLLCESFPVSLALYLTFPVADDHQALIQDIYPASALTNQGSPNLAYAAEGEMTWVQLSYDLIGSSSTTKTMLSYLENKMPPLCDLCGIPPSSSFPFSTESSKWCMYKGNRILQILTLELESVFN